MTYYLTLFYPPSRIGKRIGQYFTAAQVSAAVVGLVSAGFQEMDGARGYVGFQWMFLIYGVITIALGFAQLWWLPDRPVAPGAPAPERHRMLRWLPQSRPALTGRDSVIHYHDMKRVYHNSKWNLRDLLHVFMDWRLWPLLVMYFGVVGVGIGVQLYANVIIKAINPSLNGVDLSLLTAPIWIVSFPEIK
jgi:sugar phosphate permease